MAQPTFTFNPVEQTFTFSNEHITIAAATTILPPPPAPPQSVTVDSVTLTNHHDTFILGVHDVVVPPHVVDHVFDLI